MNEGGDSANRSGDNRIYSSNPSEFPSSVFPVCILCGVYKPFELLSEESCRNEGNTRCQFSDEKHEGSNQEGWNSPASAVASKICERK